MTQRFLVSMMVSPIDPKEMSLIPLLSGTKTYKEGQLLDLKCSISNPEVPLILKIDGQEVARGKKTLSFSKEALISYNEREAICSALHKGSQFQSIPLLFSVEFAPRLHRSCGPVKGVCTVRWDENGELHPPLIGNPKPTVSDWWFNNEVLNRTLFLGSSKVTKKIAKDESYYVANIAIKDVVPRSALLLGNFSFIATNALGHSRSTVFMAADAVQNVPSTAVFDTLGLCVMILFAGIVILGILIWFFRFQCAGTPCRNTSVNEV